MSLEVFSQVNKQGYLELSIQLMNTHIPNPDKPL